MGIEIKGEAEEERCGEREASFLLTKGASGKRKEKERLATG
jgi:hypothetical protein